MGDAREVFSLDWQNRAVEVSWQANWLNSGQLHIELRCQDILPVTETGYRSHFVALNEPPDEVFVRSYVIAWLDEAAATGNFRDREAASRQLSLF